MKLKANRGQVAFLMRAGDDLVKADMPVAQAEKIVANGEKVTETKTFPGYPLTVDEKYYFAAEAEKPRKKEE